MFDISWTTVRDRWQLFAGAILTVAMAVALTQSSLLALISAATASAPDHLPEIERLAIDEGYVAAIALLGIIVGIAFFVSIFIVSSTFAFAVAQRRRDMALLRLVGAERKQVRRLLLGESLVIGAIGTAVGVPFGMVVADLQDRMLVGLDLVPAGFETEWRLWIIAVSVGVGVVVSAIAAWGAAARAGRVRPLEALRGGLRADRVMTVWRWLIGFIAFAGATAMMIVAPLAGIAGGLALGINACFVLVIGLAAWSPLIVPPLARLFTFLARIIVPRSPLRDLVSGNVRTAVRRTASTASPIVMLVGLVVGLGSALAVMQAGMSVEATQAHTSDVVAVSDREIDELVGSIPEVDTFSTSVETVLHVMASDDPGEEELRETAVTGLAIEPATYFETYALETDRGDLATLADGAIAVSAEMSGEMDVEVGDTTWLSVAGRDHTVEVGAILPEQLNPVGEILVPSALVEDAPAGVFGTFETAVVTGSAEGVTDHLVAAGIDARTTADAIEVALDDADRQNRSIQIALLGLSALFAMVAIVNAVVVAGSDRREEYATLRLTGLTRGQVLRASLAESTIVVATGTLLGVVAAGGTAIAMSAVVTKLVDEAVFAVPWQLLGVVVATIAAVVWVTTMLTTTAMTRSEPIEVAGARE